MILAVVTHSSALFVALVAATTDTRTGRIPNILTVPAALVGVLMHVPMGVTGIVASVAGGLLALLLPWLMHRATNGAAIGGGDVKLFAALGCLCGPVMGVDIELSAFVTLAVFAIVRLAFAGNLMKMFANVLRLLARPLLPAKYRMPIHAETFTAMRMGPAIFVGVASVVVRDQLLGWVPWLTG